MATVQEVRDYFMKRLAGYAVKVVLPAEKRVQFFPVKAPVSVGDPFYIPGDQYGSPSGVVKEYLAAQEMAAVEFTAYKETVTPDTEILLEIVRDPSGARGIHAVNLDKFAEMFQPALAHMSPMALDKLPNTAFQALLDHDASGGRDANGNPAPLGYKKFLEQWRAKGLI